MVKDHGPMTAMKLQKLVYYCQAWSLALDEKPLFKGKIQAWVYGPVVYDLFKLNQGKYEIDRIEHPEANPEEFDKDQRETINLVVRQYGAMDPESLKSLAHSEPPWRNARKRGNLTPDQRGREEILHSDMREYYSSISS